VPYRKRMSHAYVTTPEGDREFCIYYGIKEISFDEVHLFAFGERLTQEAAFVAESATTWGPGYAWSELQPILQTLVNEGLLQRADDHDPSQRLGGPVSSPLPPAASSAYRMWSPATCRELFLELTGRPVEFGYLESVIPAYRLAHPALDDDGRQVGEANVFPGALRLDRSTEWRTCQYPGSRFRDERPMNVTALKAMIKHWKAMMATMRTIKAAAQPRLPRSRDGWTIGDLHSFSRVVLSLPAYLLLRRGGARPQPALHPVLSSLFRITDGIRMVTHDMLFLSAERTWLPQELVTAADLYGFAERNGMFFSQVGVCAGPKALMDEFFSVVFAPGGAALAAHGDEELAPQVRELLEDLPAALDYGFLGLQIWAVSRSTWVEASRLHAALRELCAGPLSDGDDASEAGAKLRARLDAGWSELTREHLAVAAERDVHDVVYADAYEQPGRALRTPETEQTLAERLAAVPAPSIASSRLHERLAYALIGGAHDDASPRAAAARRCAQLISTFLAYAHTTLYATAALQRRLNELLERAQPATALDLRDLRALFLLNPAPISDFPFLLDDLEQIFGLRIEVTSTSVTVEDRG
jgi:hypothetical protein